METTINTSSLLPIVSPLLQWYDSHARVLPWRENPLPYRVWISEIMLQQTRVETVKPYYERFLSALPDISSLACADEDLLMKLWEGLGYYSRVRNMQKAARMILSEHGGELPRDVALLQKLPGIGPYTAGAIASIAYGIPAPAVDGNVLRVVSRIVASRADITLPKVKKEVEQAITGILPSGRVGDFNQALMELGAMVCLPNGVALCPQCPLRSLCQAHRQNIVGELPVKAPKRQRKIEQRTVLILICGHRVALQRRPDQGLLAGLWEFPNLEGTRSKEGIAHLLDQQGGQIVSIRSLCEAKHIFSHIEWHMTGYCVELEHPINTEGWAWADQEQLLDQYALPGAFKAYTKFLLSFWNQNNV